MAPSKTTQSVKRYAFEDSNRSYGSEAIVQADLDVFLCRLNLYSAIQPDTDKCDPVSSDESEAAAEIADIKQEMKNDKVGAQDNVACPITDAAGVELLKRFVVTNHRAAHWYSLKSKKHRESHEKYAKGRILLLVAIPCIIYGISFLPCKAEGVTQITVLLSGLMAAYRASNQWLETKYSASNFRHAASSLKEQLYAFENQWAGVSTKVVNGSLVPEFETALRTGIEHARGIADKQRNDYFSATAPPAIDITELLKKSRADVTGLLKDFQSPRLAEALKKEVEANAKVLALETMEADIRNLTATLAAQNDQLLAKKSARADATDSVEQTRLDALILALSTSRNETEKQLLEKKAALSGLNVA